LDFLEVTLLVEHEFRVPIPQGAVETMPSPPIRAQLSMPAHAATGSRYWAGSLTPYMAETLADATRQAGSGASLHVTVTGATSAALALVQALFAPSGKRAIDLVVTRDTDVPRRDVQHRVR
jgi:hypothetical protein